MYVDAAILLILILIFAGNNAEGGMLRAFLLLIGVTVVTWLIGTKIPPELWYLPSIIYIVLLAVGLTFFCGTQPKQTGKIVGLFVLYQIVWAVIAHFLFNTSTPA